MVESILHSFSNKPSSALSILAVALHVSLTSFVALIDWGLTTCNLKKLFIFFPTGFYVTKQLRLRATLRGALLEIILLT